MTITQDSSAPLIAVVGATGIQGGSVVRALADSDRLYRVRGFTRDAAKPAAVELSKLGVTVVAVNFVVDNKDEVYKAFAGANFAFLVTAFWEHIDGARETTEGKLMVDAAKAAGVRGIVWSGLPSFSALSGGKYTHVWHTDSKAEVTTYGRKSGVPFVDVQTGYYGSNLLSGFSAPVKQADGSFVLAWPARPTTVVPFLDALRDYGTFVRYALELPVFPDGAEIFAYGENITVEDLVLQWSQATGKKIVFAQITEEQGKKGVERAGLPPHIALDVTEFMLTWDEFGWKGPALPQGLGRRPNTWAEFIKESDSNKVLG
ncbi:NAD(P)-binding protein [Mycena sanguinolenta]|nr:NAD(P)-binding protein [Mycena sanguinolenta]